MREFLQAKLDSAFFYKQTNLIQFDFHIRFSLKPWGLLYKSDSFCSDKPSSRHRAPPSHRVCVHLRRHGERHCELLRQQSGTLPDPFIGGLTAHLALTQQLHINLWCDVSSVLIPQLARPRPSQPCFTLHPDFHFTPPFWWHRQTHSDFEGCKPEWISSSDFF